MCLNDVINFIGEQEISIIKSKILNEAVICQLFIFYIIFQTYSKQLKSDS